MAEEKDNDRQFVDIPFNWLAETLFGFLIGDGAAWSFLRLIKFLIKWNYLAKVLTRACLTALDYVLEVENAKVIRCSTHLRLLKKFERGVRFRYWIHKTFLAYLHEDFDVKDYGHLDLVRRVAFRQHLALVLLSSSSCTWNAGFETKFSPINEIDRWMEELVDFSFILLECQSFKRSCPL